MECMKTHTIFAPAQNGTGTKTYLFRRKISKAILHDILVKITMERFDYYCAYYKSDKINIALRLRVSRRKRLFSLLGTVTMENNCSSDRLSRLSTIERGLH